MSLAIRKQEGMDISRLSILLYGFPKTGKTTEAAKFPNPLILECEPRGAQFVSGVDVLEISSLDVLERNLAEILKQPHQTLILDGFTWMLEQAVKTAPDRDPRQAYKKIGDRFITMLNSILTSNKLVIATGHSRKVEDDDTAGKIEIRPDVNPNLSDSVFGAFSIICYCYPTTAGSMMLTKPNDNAKRRILAGDRSGILPAQMKLSAADLLAAFGKPAAQSNGASKPAVTQTPTAAKPETNGNGNGNGKTEKSPTFKRLMAEGTKAFGSDAWDDARHWLIERYTRKVTPANIRTSANDLGDHELGALADALRDHKEKYQTEYQAFYDKLEARHDANEAYNEQPDDEDASLWEDATEQAVAEAVPA